MTIIHVGHFKLAFSNGVQAAIWSLARAQAQHGHEIAVLSLGREVKAPEIATAREHGIRLWGTNASILLSPSNFEEVKERIAEIQPDIVHFHSSFIPDHNYLARYLRSRSIAYVVSPHGNLCPRERARKSIRKFVYATFFEKPMLREARAATCVSEKENEDLNQYEPKASTIVVPNIVDVNLAEQAYHKRTDRTPENRQRPKGLFLGKSDIVHKGLDILFDVAPHLPADIDLHVIKRDKKEMWRAFQRLVTTKKPANVQVHDPVYGQNKVAALADADFYIHLPRWEVFGLSIVEAMACGLPVIVSECCHLAEAIVENRGGIAVPLDPKKAASLAASYLSNPDQMQADGERGRNWALQNFSPEAVVHRSTEAYGAPSI